MEQILTINSNSNKNNNISINSMNSRNDYISDEKSQCSRMASQVLSVQCNVIAGYRTGDDGEDGAADDDVLPQHTVTIHLTKYLKYIRNNQEINSKKYRQ